MQYASHERGSRQDPTKSGDKQDEPTLRQGKKIEAGKICAEIISNWTTCT
jgi:hypothetical protein